MSSVTAESELPVNLSPAQKSELRRLVEPLILFGPSNSRREMQAVTYRNVTRHRAGYRAKLKWYGEQVNFPTRRTAFEAAVDVARWYERRLGAQWAELVRRGPKLKPVKQAESPWSVRYSGKRRGYVACVFVEGVRQDVVKLKRRRKHCGTNSRWKRTDELAVFPSPSLAAEGVWVWLVRVYGPFLESIVWRHPTGKFPATAGLCSSRTSGDA